MVLTGKNILVTGGHGLVGSALRSICHEAVFVGRKDADLTDICQTRNLFEKIKPKFVIHLAAQVGGVKTNASKNADMFSQNVMINTNVLRIAQESNVQKLVTVLSNCVFEENPKNPPVENDIHVKLPFHGHLGYGFAKRMMDIHIHLLNEQYGCKFTSVMPVTIFGPHDNWDTEQGHVVGSLIHKCYLAKKINAPLEVWGSGKSVRQFVYALDIAKILLETLQKVDEPDTMIIAPGEGITIENLVQMIAEAMDFHGEILYNGNQPEGQNVRVLNGNKFKNIFPDFKFTPLKQALQETAQWFIKNYSNSIANRKILALNSG